MDADVEFVADDLEVGWGAECFSEEGACFVVGSGVVRVEEAGEGGLGVVGGHPDGVVDPFSFGGETHCVGADLAEGKLGGDRFRDGCEPVDFGAGVGERVE